MPGEDLAHRLGIDPPETARGIHRAAREGPVLGTFRPRRGRHVPLVAGHACRGRSQSWLQVVAVAAKDGSAVRRRQAAGAVVLRPWAERRR